MGKYLLKRIVYSILSIICVMVVMIFLLFTLKDKEVIFQGDPLLSKKQGNDKEYYKNSKWEKYGYIDLVEFETYINENYSKTLDYEEYEKAMYLPNDEKDDIKNPKIQEFIDYYEARGYTITRLYSQYSGRGDNKEVKPGYDPYLFATKNHSTFHRLGSFFSNMFTFETVNDVDNFVKENELEITKGYYVINSVNEWDDFYKYWGAKNFKLNLNSDLSDDDVKKYIVNIGVFEEDLVEAYEWNVMYYDGEGTFTRLFENNLTINEIGEYYFILNVEKDSNGNFSKFSGETLLSGSNPVSKKEKGSLIEVENKGIQIIWDEYSNMPALVGNGTTHRYLIYFDDKFPFIHQNIVHFSLGYSNDDNEVLSKLFDQTGEILLKEQEYPANLGTGITEPTSLDFHTATYSYSSVLSSEEISKFGSRYTVCEVHKKDVSRVAYSFFIGIMATLLAYFIGIPLGILMARKKDKLTDKIGMGYIIFIIAVPSLAYIYMITAIGSQLFGLPNNFADSTVSARWLLYVLPVVSLAMPGIAGEMKWVRRYMIDQENSDYVKFARSQGLSEKEIFSKHICKNAIIPIVHGIPGSIIGCLSGAFITEKVYSIPGTGGLLVNAITNTDNGLILGLTFLFSTLSIISLILGDILLTVVDPRISFSSGGRN